MMKRKDVWLWGLYDFANSLGLIGVMFYFGPWLVGEHGGDDVWISIVVALSTIVMLFTLPILGHLSDRWKRRMPFLSVLTLCCIFSLLALGFVGVTAGASWGLLTFFTVMSLYFLFQYFYQSSLAFYDAFLHGLSSERDSVEKISGFGMAMGSFGGVVGLVVLIPIAQGKFPLLGIVSGRPGTFIVAATLFFLAVLPVLLFLHEEQRPIPLSEEGEMKTVREILRDFRHLHRIPGVLPYLITYYLFADAILTLTLFITLYLDVVGGLTDMQKNLALIPAAFLGIVGAAMTPFFVRMFGGLKKALAAFILLWSFFIALLAFGRSPVAFITVGMLNGFAYGTLFSLSRAFYAKLIPKDRQAELFSVYVLFERGASILGPLVWSGTAFAFASFGPEKYRFSMISLALLVFISFFTLRLVKEPTEKTSE